MAGAKTIFILMIKINKGCYLFSLRCFPKEVEHVFVFLSSYRNNHESFRELEKAVEALAYPD